MASDSTHISGRGGSGHVARLHRPGDHLFERARELRRQVRRDLTAVHARRKPWLLIRPREVSRAGRPNFGGLVLGCIGADFCKQILFFGSSRRDLHNTHLCTNLMESRLVEGVYTKRSIEKMIDDFFKGRV